MDRRFLRTCIICHHEFITRCTNAKYCPSCRSMAYKTVRKTRIRERAAVKRTWPKFTCYICKRCGSSIKAHGVCTNRKICSKCLESGNTYHDKILLERRKDVLEEVM